MGLLFVPVWLANAQPFGGFDYTTNSDGSLNVSAYTGPGGIAIIPGAVGNLPVTSIGPWAFYAASVSTVFIPDSVTNVSDGAFFDCVSLTNVTIGAGVANIGDWAFAFCTGLAAVDFRGNPPSLGGANVFYAVSPIAYYLPTGSGWNATFDGFPTVLWNPPVPYNYLTNNQTITVTEPIFVSDTLNIPPTINFLPVTTIAADAYFSEWASYANIFVPGTVTNIQDGAFTYAFGQGGGPVQGRLLNMTVDSNNLVYSSIDGVLFDKSQTTLLDYPEGRFGSYAIPNGVSSVASNAFFYCSGLSTIAIPASVTNLGTAATTFFLTLSTLGNNPFASCAGLTDITVDSNNPVYSSLNGALFDKSQTTLIVYPQAISGNYVVPSHVSDIADNAFEFCAQLIGITIPASVTNLGANAFFGCSGLVRVSFLGDAPNADPTAFVRASGMAYYLSDTSGWTSNFDGLPAMPWDDSVPFLCSTNNGTITITDYMGSGGNVVVPDFINGLPVTAIGKNAFADVSPLTGITFGSNVTTIFLSAFTNCTGLSNLNIPDNVTILGSQAFYGCSGLTNITIGSGLAIMQSVPFGNCYHLAAISVSPDNSAFSSLNGVLFDKAQKNLLAYPAALGGVYSIPNNVTNIGFGAFQNSSLSGVLIPNSVVLIERQAFSYCTNLTNALIPASATIISPGIFVDCPALSLQVDPNNPKLFCSDGVLFEKNPLVLLAYPIARTGGYTVPNGVVTIEDFAFAYCALSSVTIPNSVQNIGPDAFRYSPNLTSVTIGGGISLINDFAFANCNQLTAVYFQGNAPAYILDAFDEDPALGYYLPGTTGWGNISYIRNRLVLLPLSLPYPLILSAASGSAGLGIHNNQLSFSVSWNTNASLVVEATTNLTNPVWQPLQTNTLNNGSFSFTDTQWSNYPSRFYRVRTP